MKKLVQARLLALLMVILALGGFLVLKDVMPSHAYSSGFSKMVWHYPFLGHGGALNYSRGSTDQINNLTSLGFNAVSTTAPDWQLSSADSQQYKTFLDDARSKGFTVFGVTLEDPAFVTQDDYISISTTTINNAISQSNTNGYGFQKYLIDVEPQTTYGWTHGNQTLYLNRLINLTQTLHNLLNPQGLQLAVAVPYWFSSLLSRINPNGFNTLVADELVILDYNTNYQSIVSTTMSLLGNITIPLITGANIDSTSGDPYISYSSFNQLVSLLQNQHVSSPSLIGVSAFQSSALPHPLPFKQSPALDVGVCVDGADHLYFNTSSDMIWIVHGTRQLPGWQSGCASTPNTGNMMSPIPQCPSAAPCPEIVKTYDSNGFLTGTTSWMPNWFTDQSRTIMITPTVDGCVNCNGYASSILPIGNVPQAFNMTLLQGRCNVSIIQSPSTSNGKTMIVEFNDDIGPNVGGPGWYDILLGSYGISTGTVLGSNCNAAFTLSNSGPVTSIPGSSGSNMISISWNGLGTDPLVSLYCSNGLPIGASCILSPPSGTTPYSSTLTILTNSSTHLGSYTVKVTGNGDEHPQSTQFTLTVQGGPVGGKIIPVDKLQIILPFLGIAILTLGVSLVVVRYGRKARMKKPGL